MSCKWGSKLLKIIYFLKIFYINFNIIVFLKFKILRDFFEVFNENIFKNIAPKAIP
jgi:hypothetical protein